MKIDRRKAMEILPFIKALANGERLEVKNMNGTWWKAEDFIHLDKEYRIPPKNRYRPFTKREFEQHRDRFIRMTACDITCKVLGYNNNGVLLPTIQYSFEDLMKYNFFDDNGKPCGMEMSE